jgi:hypothetical protein
MKNCEVSERDDKYMSWDEFKEQYLPKVEYLAEITGLPRDYYMYKEATVVYEEDIEECSIDEDNRFVAYVMRCILDWEGKYVTTPLLHCIRETDGAEEIFDEVYRVWANRFCRGDELLFRRRPVGRGTRSEPGKGDIVDIFLIDKSADSPTLLNHGSGEDFADCVWPVAVKVKHKSCMSKKELTKGLRDLADALEADFKNCYLPTSDGYRVIGDKKHQAVLIGLHENNPDLHSEVTVFNFPLDEAIKETGWIDPNISLDSGLREMLQGGWPKLYKRVLWDGMTPFEALLETGCVDARTVYEVFKKNGKFRDIVEKQKGQAERIEYTDKDLLQHLENL